MKCTHYGGKSHYVGQQTLPASLAKKVGKQTVRLYECDECGTSFIHPDDAAMIEG